MSAAARGSLFLLLGRQALPEVSLSAHRPACHGGGGPGAATRGTVTACWVRPPGARCLVFCGQELPEARAPDRPDPCPAPQLLCSLVHFILCCQTSHLGALAASACGVCILPEGFCRVSGTGATPRSTKHRTSTVPAHGVGAIAAPPSSADRGRPVRSTLAPVRRASPQKPPGDRTGDGQCHVPASKTPNK